MLKVEIISSCHLISSVVIIIWVWEKKQNNFHVFISHLEIERFLTVMQAWNVETWLPRFYTGFQKQNWKGRTSLNIPCYSRNQRVLIWTKARRQQASAHWAATLLNSSRNAKGHPQATGECKGHGQTMSQMRDKRAEKNISHQRKKPQ